PITPLHFGINGTVRSISPSRIDVMSCILANVLLDIQPFLVIFFGLNIELHGTSHTLLFAIITGSLFFTLYGVIVKKIFHIKKPLSAYIIGGVIGGILHIALDSFYHSDVRPFYPFSNINFAYLGMRDEVILLCLIGYITFLIALTIRFYLKVRNNA
ncbi:MAG: metal-dependent hydrolase, partial [bacterium]|nr:metal-dependent hydrolase [bacterium]